MRVRPSAFFIVFFSLALAGAFFVLREPVSAQEPSMMACSMEAMLCPDGSAVSRTGPRCEFAPCPGTPGYLGPPVTPMEAPAPGVVDPRVVEGSEGGYGGSMPAEPGDGVVYPAESGGVVSPQTGNTAWPYPDKPLGRVPLAPVSPQFLMEHRTALNGHQVTVVGVVVSVLPAEKACPPDMGLCAQPNIVIADTAGPRDTGYDLPVFLAVEDQTPYRAGQRVSVRVAVIADSSALMVTKN